MTRDELVTIAVNAGVWANEGEINSVLDVLESVIRADERDAVAEDIAIAIENWDEGSRLREWQRTASTIARSFKRKGQ